MYCRNCGKFIGTDDELCEECLHNDLVFGQEQKAASQQVTAPVANPAPSTPSAPQQSVQAQTDRKSIRMTGFPPALASTILGIVAYILLIVSLVMAAGYSSGTTSANIQYGTTHVYYSQAMLEGQKAAAIVLYVLGLPMTAVALSLGIRAIVRSVRTKRQYDIMPVPALVLSIVGTVASGISAILAFAATMVMTHF